MADGEGSGAPGPDIEILEFGRRYFAHHCENVPSRFHLDLAAELDRIIASPDSERTAIAAPRGSAKTTWVSLILPIYCIVHDLKRHIVLITNASGLANNLIRDIKHELEANEDLARDFPHACGRGSSWRDDEIITRNDIKVVALGAGQRVRGQKFRQHRPDLFILDDLENDEQVRSPEQRDKMHDWLAKAVLNAKGLAKKADVFVVGTVLHFDSVLARLLDERKSPGWRSMKYRSVIRFSDRPDLWQQWEDLYTDYLRPTDDRRARALGFYQNHEDEMLEGTEVLWPQVETYYDLMCIRVDHGPIAFDSEKQNEPIDPSMCQFLEDWFEWFDLEPISGETWIVPDKGDRIKLGDCDIYGAVDPSMGKRDKHRDPSAIVAIAAYPSQRLQIESEYQSFWCLDADIQRRHPQFILRDILDLHRTRHFTRIGIEAIQFQELFADQVQQSAPELHVVKLIPLGDKALRIQKLSPLIYNGRLRFHRKLTELYNQLRYWPQASHDDGPDALELCIETIKQRGWQLLDSVVGNSYEEDKTLHGYDQQLREGLPECFDVPTETCSSCAAYVQRSATEGKCTLREFIVGRKMPACEFYAFGSYDDEDEEQD